MRMHQSNAHYGEFSELNGLFLVPMHRVSAGGAAADAAAGGTAAGGTG